MNNQFNFQNRSNIQQELKDFFFSKNMVARLIIINVAVFVFINLVFLIFWLFTVDHDFITRFIAVPSNLSQLIYRPWTLFTYMFYHEGFMHILFNMLWLYWFGRIFLQFLKESQLLTVYILGGITGAFFFILSFNLFPVFDEAVMDAIAYGASASVMAVVFAVSVLKPRYSINLMFLGSVKIIYIAFGLFVIDLLMVSSENSGGHLAHIGGAAFGFLYSYLLLRGFDISSFFSGFSFKKLFYKEKKSPFNNVYSQAKNMTDEEYNYNKNKHQEEIDKILEKISKSGYESLSKIEKETLFKASKK